MAYELYGAIVHMLPLQRCVAQLDRGYTWLCFKSCLKGVTSKLQNWKILHILFFLFMLLLYVCFVFILGVLCFVGCWVGFFCGFFGGIVFGLWVFVSRFCFRFFFFRFFFFRFCFAFISF